MIVFGWRIKPLIELHIDIPEFESSCDKHKIKHRLIIGKRYNTLYFIPINYLWAKEQVFRICDKCNSDYEEIPKEFQKIILEYYYNRISFKDLHNKIKVQIQEHSQRIKKEVEKDDEYLTDFIKKIPYMIGFLILLVIIKIIFF